MVLCCVGLDCIVLAERRRGEIRRLEAGGFENDGAWVGSERGKNE